MKKIHINESKLKENFNEDLEPMNDFDRTLSKSLDGWNEKDAYLKTLQQNNEIPDDLFFSYDNDDINNEINQYILTAANEGASAFKAIKHYIETNQYIQDNPEKFKNCVEKIAELTDNINRFIDEYKY